MPEPKVQNLIEAAKSGQKLSTSERRHALAFLTATRPDVANTELAGWFGVTERTIREDKRKIREQFAKLVRQEDVGLVVADIIQEYHRQVVDIESSKRQAVKGTRVYLDHCMGAMEMRLKTVKALQDLGFYPKNLGNMTVEKFEYKAFVRRDGSVEVRSVDLLDDEADETLLKGDDQERTALDAEFQEVPALPPASVEFSGNGSENSETL